MEWQSTGAGGVRPVDEVGFGAIVSARSGESEYTAIVHRAVDWGALQLKVGSITRGEVERGPAHR